MRKQFLYIDISSGSELFLTRGTRPVWPVRCDADLEALGRLAEFYGVSIMEVRGHAGRVLSGAEEVVSLGEDVAQEAMLYAHLTARRHRGVEDLTHLAKGPLPAVVFMAPRMLDDRLLELLYLDKSRRAGRRAAAPGIICGEPKTLRQQVLLHSAAAMLGGTVDKRRVDFYPPLPIRRWEQSDWEVLGGGAQAQDILDALRQRIGVLTVFTHSDGIDAFLGTQLTLCPMNRLPEGADEHRSPRCYVTGICHRNHQPVSEALGSDSLLAPDALSARVLVWSVCWGLLPPTGMIDPVWGLARSLTESPTLGAIITTWEMILIAPHDLDDLTSLLARGIPVGRALARFLRAPGRRWMRRMCLLGDPRVRVPTRRGEPVQSESRKKGRRLTTKQPETSDLKELSLLRAILTELPQTLSSDALGAAEKALALLQRYERSLWNGNTVEGAPEALGPSLRRATIQFLFQRGSLTPDWLRLAYKSGAVLPPPPCHICGRQTNTVKMSLRLPGVSRRRVTTCPLCGPIEDAPVGSTLKLRLERSTVQLSGNLPQQRWSAGVLLKSATPPYSVGYDWPAKADGAPCESFEPPEPWPPGPLRIIVFMMSGEGLLLVSLPARSGRSSVS